LILKITHVLTSSYYSEKSSKSATSKYSPMTPIWPKLCTQAYLFMCNKGSLVELYISNF